MNLGILYWNGGRLQESTAMYTEALSLCRKLDLKDQESACIAALQIYEAYSKGKELRSSGLSHESVIQFGKAISLANRIKSLEHELKCLRQLSINYLSSRTLQEFFLLNDKALRIARELNHRQEEGRCLNNIGVFYWKLNSYSKALVFFDEALAIARETNSGGEDESNCLNNIGLIYRDIGDYRQSLKYLLESLNMDLKLKDDIGISIDLNNIGAIFRVVGESSGNTNDFQKALNYFLESLEISRRTKNQKLEIEILNNIGLTYSALRNYLLSLKHFLFAYDKAKATSDLHEFSNICSNIGDVYLNISNFNQSKKFYFEALNLALNSGINEVLWEAYFGLGQCLEGEHQVEQALLYYQKAIEIIDLIRSYISLEDHRAGFGRDKLKVYESVINLLFKLKKDGSTCNYDEEIYRVIERAKARTFLEGLKESEDSAAEKLNLELQGRRSDISKKISLSISKLASMGLSETERLIILERLEKEENEYMALLNKIKSGMPSTLGWNSFKTVSIADVQKEVLDPETAILEYYLGEKRSYVFLITRNDFILKALPSQREIEDSLKAYLKMLSTPPGSEFRGILAAKRLYNDIFFSFDDFFAPAIKNLIIIPDGILYYLPFETLIADKEDRNSTPKYLVEHYNISYAPSISSLVFLINKHNDKKSPKHLLAIGNPVYASAGNGKNDKKISYQHALREIYLSNGFDFAPLPYSKREIMQISRHFPKNRIDIFLDEAAKEEVVKDVSIEDYRVIHFACHGFLDEKIPHRSALVLSLDNNGEEDGFLQVREIQNLRLNADLVVLSACQTGRGKMERGEGILGLPRIFFYAGARSTLSTLWKINDKSTSNLMQSFYHYLSKGNSKAHALRLAKVRMIKSKFSHPFYWAAFVLNGDFSSQLWLK